MELQFYEEHRRLSHGSGSVGIYRRLPRLEGGSDQIEACYRQAADAMEQWVKECFGPQLEEAFQQTARQSRLHRVVPRILFVCSGNLTADRFLSVTLTVTRESPEGGITSTDYRVWDAREGILCPLELFLPKKRARKFHPWQFELRGEQVYALPGKTRKDVQSALVCAGNWKNSWLSIDNVR